MKMKGQDGNMAEQVNYREPHIVWTAIVSLFHFAQNYTAALRAYAEVYRDKETNAYIDISQEAIWRQLLSEISKIYDKEATCGKNNCSLRQLYFSCLHHKGFPNDKNDAILKQVDALYARYKSLFPLELRNKKIAHYDLEAMFAHEQAEIPLDDVELFINDTADILSQIGGRLFGAELANKYSELVEKYKNSLLSITVKGDTHDQL